jgi:hypothetical protein
MASLTAYWQALAQALDDLEVVVLTGGSTSTAVSTLLVSSATGITTGAYEGRWIYQYSGANAPQQRKVSIYAPGSGTLTVPTNWLAPASGDAIALTSLHPITGAIGSDTDYRTICDRAFGRMFLTTEVTTPITLSGTYPMTSYPWLDRQERLLSIKEPHPAGGVYQPVDASWRGWELIPGSPVAKLNVRRPYLTATGNVTINAIRPALTWIKVAGTWGESVTGLINETDEAQPSIAEFLPFALTEALPRLIARSPGRPNAEWLTLLKQAEDDVKQSRFLDRTQLVAQQPTPAPLARAS